MNSRPAVICGPLALAAKYWEKARWWADEGTTTRSMSRGPTGWSCNSIAASSHSCDQLTAAVGLWGLMATHPRTLIRQFVGGPSYSVSS